jgi:acetyl-CoA acyltransferase
MREVAVIGVGMTRFGRYDDKSSIEHGVEVTQAALKDAGLGWKEVQIAYCGAAQQGMTPATRVLAGLGTTGIPFINVENASASGSTAFREAYLAVATGLYDIALALGVGKMGRAFALASSPEPVEFNLMKAMGSLQPASFFAMRMRRRMKEYGTSIDSLARVSVKNHRHAVYNPYAQYPKEVTLEEVHRARMICDPVTVLHLCPTGDGGAAAILCSKEKAEKYSARPLITVAASAFRTQVYSSKRHPSPDVTTVTAKEAYEQVGCGPWDMDLVQVHEAATVEEIDNYELLGFCNPGEGERLIDDGVTQIGGRIPFNTDGGLLARGHPIGPTGLAQIWETVMQLRGEAGQRQVEGARIGMAHMIGYEGVCIIHILKKRL